MTGPLGARPVMPVPAATVVLVRPGPAGPEVLLTKRPASMAFGPELHVFPGGRVDAADADARAAAVRETREEVGIGLDPAALVPLSRWVTPRSLPRRFDVRFFVAAVPAATESSASSREVEEARWMRPRDALDAMAAGSIALWLPTSATLQQLAWVGDLDELVSSLPPETRDASGPTVLPTDGPATDLPVVGIESANAGGIRGRRATTWLVGRRELVVVDPADPVPETAVVLEQLAERRGGRIVGVALTHLDPEHHAGVEVFATDLGVPVVAGRGAAREAPYELAELGDGEAVPFGDVRLVARALPGPRPEHTGYAISGAHAVLCGDLLDGPPGIRAGRGVLPPPDVAAWHASLDRLRSGGTVVVLPAHGTARHLSA